VRNNRIISRFFRPGLGLFKINLKIFFGLLKIQVTDEEIAAVEEATRGQSLNPLWGYTRQCRLTSSNFGAVLSVAGKRKPSPSLMNKVLNLSTSESSQFHATKWGQDNEATARKEFEKKYNQRVDPSGLWLHPCGFLAGSPDGLVGNTGIIEVKCPYKWRNAKLEEVLGVDNLECLYNQQRSTLKKDTYVAVFNEGNWHLNEDHEYFHQIQGNLHITNREFCHLILWTPKSLVCLKIDKDEEWGRQFLPALSSFFFQELVPHVAGLDK